jgi:hypothetical protein
MSRNITLSVDDNVHERMRTHSEIRWSEVARNAIVTELELLDAVDAIARKSKLSEKDVEELARKVKRGVARRHGLD